MKITLTVNFHVLHCEGADSLESQIKNFALLGYDELEIISCFMTKGFEYSCMKKRVLALKKLFRKITFTKPFLHAHFIGNFIISGKKRINDFARFLISEYILDFSTKYLFVGHGLKDSKNREYHALEKRIQQYGFTNVKIALLQGEGSEIDKISFDNDEVKKIILIPLLINLGKHAQNDILGDKDSLASDLEKRGFSVERQFSCLGMNQRFKKEYLNE